MRGGLEVVQEDLLSIFVKLLSLKIGLLWRANPYMVATLVTSGEAGV